MSKTELHSTVDARRRTIDGA